VNIERVSNCVTTSTSKERARIAGIHDENQLQIDVSIDYSKFFNRKHFRPLNAFANLSKEITSIDTTLRSGLYNHYLCS